MQYFSNLHLEVRARHCRMNWRVSSGCLCVDQLTQTAVFGCYKSSQGERIKDEIPYRQRLFVCLFVFSRVLHSRLLAWTFTLCVDLPVVCSETRSVEILISRIDSCRDEKHPLPTPQALIGQVDQSLVFLSPLHNWEKNHAHTLFFFLSLSRVSFATYEAFLIISQTTLSTDNVREGFHREESLFLTRYYSERKIAPKKDIGRIVALKLSSTYLV